MSARPDHICCVVRDTSPHGTRTSYCKRVLPTFEWAFVSREHAEANEAREGRLVTCPECKTALRRKAS
jgi:hypothetical protein